MTNNAITDSGLCEHVRPGQWPFQVVLVLDEHLGPTEALMRCRRCGRSYLLEMLDWRGAARAMRVAVLDPAHADTLVRDLTRGSCDVRRAGAEVQHVRQLAPLLPLLLLVDTAGPVVEAIVGADDVKIPTGSWRSLPCNGEWIDYARSKTDIVNG